MATYIAGDVWDLTATAPGAPDLSGFTVTWKLLDSAGDTVESASASGDDQGVMTYSFNSSGYVSTGAYTSVFTADDGAGTIYTCSTDITSVASFTIGDLITLGDVIPAILLMINNPNKTEDAKAWIKMTCREIASAGRWNYLMRSATHDFDTSSSQIISMPDDWRETLDPIYMTTDSTYAVGSGDWSDVYAAWPFENTQPFRIQSGDYRVINNLGLYINSRWSSGTIWMDYYRKMTEISYNLTIPDPEGGDPIDVIYDPDQEVPDVPRDFAFKILVYGSARYGLIHEDDFDRLRFCEQKFQEGLTEMKTWDARRGVANMRARASGSVNVGSTGLMLPPNYSV